MDFETMVRRGLGRAVLYARENNVSMHRDFLLDACLHNAAFDPQWEMTRRGVYMFDLIQAAGDTEFYSSAMIAALENPGEDLSISQIYEILSGLGFYGDEKARRTLYDAVAQNLTHDCFYIAEALVKMDRVPGLIFVLERLAGQDLPKSEHWHLGELLRIAVETDEEETALNIAVAERPALVDTIALMRDVREKVKSSGPHVPRFALPPDYAEITRLIQTLDKRTSHSRYTRWGTQLDEETIARLAKDTLAETDPERLRRYLYLFEERVFPLEHQKLLELALDSEYMVAYAARGALSPIVSEDVRDLAVNILSGDGGYFEAVDLLNRNYEEGDWSLVERVVARDMEPDDYHGVVIDAKHFFEEHPSPDAKAALLHIYERGPCSLCRETIVENLHDLGELPDRMIQECLYDASENTRDFVRFLLAEEK